MAERIQVILESPEKEQLQRQARLEGTSLSAWIRRAALDRLAASTSRPRLDSAKRLRAFFRDCDRAEQGEEPDWEQHLEVIARSIRSGGSET